MRRTRLRNHLTRTRSVAANGFHHHRIKRIADTAQGADQRHGRGCPRVRDLRVEAPGVEIVVEDLWVSPRTLQRRRQEFGTNDQRLLDEVRQDTARKLLAATDPESDLLGFEELNSFARAFHGWEGATPVRWHVGHVAASKGMAPRMLRAIVAGPRARNGRHQEQPRSETRSSLLSGTS